MISFGKRLLRRSCISYNWRMRFFILVGLGLIIALGCAGESGVQESPAPDMAASPAAMVVAASASSVASTPEAAIAPLTSTPSIISSDEVRNTPIPTGNHASTPAPTLSPTPARAAELITAAPMSSPVTATTPPLRPLDLQPAFPNMEPVDRLVGMTTAKDGTNRLFLVSQPGHSAGIYCPNRRGCHR